MEDKELIAYCQLTRSDLCDVEVVSDDIMRFLIRRTRTCRVKFGILTLKRLIVSKCSVKSRD